MFSQFMQGDIKQERSESVWTKEDNKELEQSEYELVRNQTLMEKPVDCELLQSDYSKKGTEMYKEEYKKQGTEMYSK